MSIEGGEQELFWSVLQQTMNDALSGCQEDRNDVRRALREPRLQEICKRVGVPWGYFKSCIQFFLNEKENELGRICNNPILYHQYIKGLPTDANPETYIDRLIRYAQNNPEAFENCRSIRCTPGNWDIAHARFTGDCAPGTASPNGGGDTSESGQGA